MDTFSGPVSGDDQRTKKPMPVGVRFKPGVSACPGGRRGVRRQLMDAFTAELGGDLSAIDHERLRAAVDALIEARSVKATADERNKHRRTANMILGALRRSRSAKPAASRSLTSADLLRGG